MDDALLPLAQTLGYAFKQPGLLRQALTHSSFLSENVDGQQSNERLEFLGDAVVGLAVGRLLMERVPEAREGELTKLRAMVVREASLAQAAQQLALGRYLRMGKGEELSGGRDKPSILSDAFEALVGAIFLDGGFERVDGVVRRLLGPLAAEAVRGVLDTDHKSRLKELAEKEWRDLPRYLVLEEWGPPHAKVFCVGVFQGAEELARADGPSKKAAEQQAACLALSRREQRD
jgi:ribonuclease III